MYRKHVGRALILALMLSGATSMNAQRITRQFKNVPLKTVLAEVEKELQYSIIYKKDEVNERKQITRDFKDASLEEVLSAVLDNGLSYSVQGKMIVISKKEAAGSSITQQKQIIVKGIVKDENGEPVVGANVVEKGTSNGTITDMDGNFSLSISEGSKLSITYIGYLDKDVAVSKGKTTLNIQLKEDTQALDEVVVVGYGSVKKRDLTGSVSQISSSSIQNQAVMKDPMQALQGKIAGADITMGNSPGASSTIVIRGYNSINAVGALPMAKITGFSICAAFSMLTAALVTPRSFAIFATSSSAIKQCASPPYFASSFLLTPASAMFVSVTMSAPFCISFFAIPTAWAE